MCVVKVKYYPTSQSQMTKYFACRVCVLPKPWTKQHYSLFYHWFFRVAQTALPRKQCTITLRCRSLGVLHATIVSRMLCVHSIVTCCCSRKCAQTVSKSRIKLQLPTLINQAADQCMSVWYRPQLKIYIYYLFGYPFEHSIVLCDYGHVILPVHQHTTTFTH